MKPSSRVSVSILTALIAAANAGCPPTASDTGQVTETQQLHDNVEAQQRLLIAKDEQIEDQSARIQELQGLTGERSIERLVHVAKIDLSSLTGGYDDNRDGVDDGVVVYLVLTDQDGDTIKAAGSCEVRLLDLNNPSATQLVGEAKLGPEELRKTWYGRFMTSHYTIKVPWAGGAPHPAHKTITILVRFTDLLSGQTFETQRAVDVAGAGTSGGK